MGRKQFSEAQETMLEATLKAIIAGLPTGYHVTNKRPVQKEIQAIDSFETTTVWTSWCKDAAGARYLAFLKSDGRVKLLDEKCLVNYKLHSI